MREILFRGKICRDCKGVTTQKKYKEGDWAFGDLSRTNYNPPLIDQSNDDPVPVDPDTVGQYTGLQDKNGKRIFEGDIIRDGDDIYLCFWDGCNVEFGVKNKDFSFGIAYLLIRECEVIGNIHDNETLAEDICNWAGEDTQEQEDK